MDAPVLQAGYCRASHAAPVIKSQGPQEAAVMLTTSTYGLIIPYFRLLQLDFQSGLIMGIWAPDHGSGGRLIVFILQSEGLLYVAA